MTSKTRQRVTQIDVAVNRKRWRAKNAVLVEHGIEPDPELFFETVDHVELGGVDAADWLLDKDLPATAVFASTDRCGIALMQRLIELGVRVPEQVAVVGFDDIDLCLRVSPTLSTVRQSFTQVGTLAARLVLAQLAGDDVPFTQHRVASHFMARESCGCVAPRIAHVPSVAPGGTATVYAGDLQDTVLAIAAAVLPDATGEERERLAAAVIAISDAADNAATDRTDIDRRTVQRAARTMLGLNPSHESLQHAVMLLTNLLHRRAMNARSTWSRDALAMGATQVAWQFAEEEAHLYIARSTALEMGVREQFLVATHLLDHDRNHAGSLEWLANSSVTFGALALWIGAPSDGRLTIEGIYDPSATLPDFQRGDTDVEAFPPP